MGKKLSNLSMIMSSWPLLLASGAILLFALGYYAHKLHGENSPLEQLSEDLLKRGYNITVEFSGNK